MMLDYLLTGDTPQEERQEMCDRFQRGESKVFVGTIKAGGVGITLCHRIGQKSAVSAYWVQLGIIDEKIDSLIANK